MDKQKSPIWIVIIFFIFFIVILMGCETKTEGGVTTPTHTILVPRTIPATLSETPETFTLEAMSTMSLYYLSYGIAYGVIPQKVAPIESSQTGLENSLDLVFSHFSNLVAYWEDRSPLELWISDLDGQGSKLIFTDTQNVYYVPPWPIRSKNVELIWSPDDHFLIIQANGVTNANLLYDMQRDEIRVWKYRCDRVALSPRTNRLATWCPSLENTERSAVLEWGGDIWYSDLSPTKELVRRSDDHPFSWEWSSDGSQIAFFDPNDSTGHFYIVDEHSKVRLKILPGSAYWLSEEPSLALPDSAPVQWSKNGSRVLVYAIGNQTYPCPLHIDTTIDRGQAYVVPCWMVLDSATGDVVWTLSELSAEIDYSGLNIQMWFFRNAAISPDSNYLTITANYSGLSHLEYIDLRSNQVVTLVDGLYINAIHWNN